MDYRYLIGMILVIVGVPATTYSFSNPDCLSCHGEKEMESAYVSPSEFEVSVHSDLACTDCHQGITDLPHEEKLKEVSCQECHFDVAEIYKNSIHGRERKNGNEIAASCSDCHGTHNIRPSDDPSSSVYPMNLPGTCAKCHEEEKAREEIPISKPYKLYVLSVHGKALIKKKSVLAPTCTSCHGSHDIYRANSSLSKINRNNIPKLCGGCHAKVLQIYIKSIHGVAFQKGASDAPICTNCHGEHDILAPEEPTSLVYAGKISKNTCPQCHNAERIVRKYGLPSDRIATYLDSYHGLADKFGDATVANCASCHGVHEIYPSTDPRSLVHPDKLVKTCGKCHPKATANFAKGRVHGTVVKSKLISERVKYYVRLFYIILIPTLILGMFMHNMLDYGYRLRIKYRALQSELAYIRMTLPERAQHIILLACFTILALSGFALRFRWNLPFISGEMNTLLRGGIHRVAAVIFIGVSFYHIYYVIVYKRGRKFILEMIPKLEDIKEIINTVGCYIGMRKEFPKFGRFTYIEKLEYLALVWGTLIMILTGLVLWFEETAMQFIPKWGMDVANIIHYYEAILATLAIIVWHFYHVHIKPGATHTNLSWITGKLTEDEMKEEHPKELEELQNRK